MSIKVRIKKRIHLQAAPPDGGRKNRGRGVVYYCTACGDNLEAQEGFDPEGKTWICRNCGQLLYGAIYEGEFFPGVIWNCDQCGALLNDQEGFTDRYPTWNCKACGFENKLDTIIDCDEASQAIIRLKEEGKF